MKKLGLISAAAAVAAISAFTGFVGASVAADAADKLALAPDNKVGKGIYVGKGEDAEALKRAAALNIKEYEPAGKEGGLGAPQRTLIDNDAMMVNLVAFKKGFIRPGGYKRKYNTVLIYVDQGRFTITRSGGASAPNPNPTSQNLAPGSSVFHWKESIVSESRIDEDYRVLFVMTKN
jgi:hypothetical protein